MRWLDRLERVLGPYAITQLPLVIVLTNGLIYILSMIRPEFTDRLTLVPEAIYHGEVWRLVTFLFIPPPMSPIAMAFSLYLLYYCAQVLEREWGEFRFNFFYLVGGAATAFAALAIAKEPLSNVPLNMMIFMAFATLCPDFELLLFFIIRIKVKYVAWFLWVVLAYWLIAGTFATRVTVGSALVNYLLFFGPALWQSLWLRWSVYQNRRRFKTPPD